MLIFTPWLLFLKRLIPIFFEQIDQTLLMTMGFFSFSKGALTFFKNLISIVNNDEF